MSVLNENEDTILDFDKLADLVFEKECNSKDRAFVEAHRDVVRRDIGDSISFSTYSKLISQPNRRFGEISYSITKSGKKHLSAIVE